MSPLCDDGRSAPPWRLLDTRVTGVESADGWSERRDIEAGLGSRSCSAPRRNATVTRTRVPSTVTTASSHRARSLPSFHAAPPNICDSAFGSGRCDERAGDLSFGVLRMGEHLCSRCRCLVWTTKRSVPSRAPSRLSCREKAYPQCPQRFLQSRRPRFVPAAFLGSRCHLSGTVSGIEP